MEGGLVNEGGDIRGVTKDWDEEFRTEVIQSAIATARSGFGMGRLVIGMGVVVIGRGVVVTGVVVMG